MGSQVIDAALAALLKKACAFGCGVDLHAACVMRIASNFDHAAMLESGHDAAHGGGLDLLGSSEFAERLWAGKDQHGECGQLRWADAGSHILLPHAAQQMDGGGVKACAGRDGFS